MPKAEVKDISVTRFDEELKKRGLNRAKCGRMLGYTGAAVQQACSRGKMSLPMIIAIDAILRIPPESYLLNTEEKKEEPKATGESDAELMEVMNAVLHELKTMKATLPKMIMEANKAALRDVFDGGRKE